MFGSSKRHVFKPTAYGTTRRSRRIPRWLVLMLTGVVLGSGGLLFLQKSYGPSRLTVEQSEQLHYELNSVKMDKQRLESDVSRQTRDLNAIQEKQQAQTADLEKAQTEVQKLTQDLQLFADAMPSDPRGTSPGIRAASFSANGTELNYQILLMQDQGKTEPFKGQVQLVVAGRYPNRKSANIELPVFNIELQRYTHASGSAALPDGFKPSQVTIKVTREGAERVVATRTIRVSS